MKIARHGVVLLPVLLLSCGAPPVANVEHPPPAHTVAQTQAAPGDDAFHAVTTLRQAGAEPRRPLAYRFSTASMTTMQIATEIDYAGAVSTFHMTLVATMKPTADGASGDLRFPQVDVTPPGDATPELLEKLTMARASLVGRAGSFDVDLHGTVRNVDVKGESDKMFATMVLQELVEVLVVPLPFEPVGPGAEWTRVETKAGAAPMTITTRVKLLSYDDATAKLELTRTSVSTRPVGQDAVANNSTTSTFEIVFRADGVAQRVDGSIATTLTMRAPNQPDQSATVRVTRHASSAR